MENNQANRSTETERPGCRSGVAARLAGLSAATLRVWERRYQLTAAPRSVTGQRLYTPEQVRRLGLLKQLVDQGHPIGTLAALPPQRLLALVDAGPGQPAAVDQIIDVAAIGAGLLRRLAAAIDEGLPLRLRPHDDASAAPAVLLVELAEPGAAALSILNGARERSGAAAVVVLYRFCSSATVRLLRAAGFMVARFPGEMGELPVLCRAALQRHPTADAAVAPQPPAPPRFDDVTLAAISARIGKAADNRLDSARALAEMLLHMGSFERYSARCAIGAPTPDAALHRELEGVAGRAREVLEQAMGRLLRAGD
jgi:hypothetical protein